MPQANAPDSLNAFVFHSNANQCLTCSTAPALAGFFLAADVRLIDLNYAAQFVPARPDHSSAQFVQPLPGGVITPQVQHPLQSKGIGSVFLVSDVPHRPEP